MLPSDSEDAELTEKDDDDDGESVAVTSTTDTEEATENDSEYQEDEEEEWSPPVPSSNKTPKANRHAEYPGPSTPSYPTLNKAQFKPSRMSQLAKDIVKMTIDKPSGDDSIVILPSKKFKAQQPSAQVDEEDGSDDVDIPVVKKKKRCVSYLYFIKRDIEGFLGNLGKTLW